MSEVERDCGETCAEGLIRLLKEGGDSHAEVLDTALMMVWELLKDLDDLPNNGPISNIYGFTTQEEAILKTARRMASSAASLLGLLRMVEVEDD